MHFPHQVVQRRLARAVREHATRHWRPLRDTASCGGDSNEFGFGGGREKSVCGGEENVGSYHVHLGRIARKVLHEWND